MINNWSSTRLIFIPQSPKKLLLLSRSILNHINTIKLSTNIQKKSKMFRLKILFYTQFMAK
jgi:hypothetical protein